MVIMAKIVIIIIASGKIEWASVYLWVDRQNKQKQGGLLLLVIMAKIVIIIIAKIVIIIITNIVIIIIASGKIEWASVYPWVDLG